ncbi:MAG: hypothetical protein VYC34_07665, partial [Planctomycetota bacterium]|nr:hypothetical protein [Planctomycetota bacterium]
MLTPRITLATFAAATTFDAAASSPALAATYFVSTCGQDIWAGVAPGCVGPTGPKRTVQAAVNAANDGDTILILPGTYVGTIDLDGKAIRIASASDDPASVILDGAGAGPVVLINSGEDQNTVIEAVTIRNGFSNQPGAGMRIALSSPTIREVVFENNHSMSHGGAIYSAASSPQIIDCGFVNNHAGPMIGAGVGNGGAISFEGGLPTLEGAQFELNIARTRGGAVHVGPNTTIAITDSVFSFNWVDAFGGAWGGGLAIHGATATIADSRIVLNGSDHDAAGVSIEGGADVSFTSVEFSDNQFYGGSSRRGAGVSVIASEANFLSCEFNGNSGGFGGAIYASASDVSILFSGFYDNEAGFHQSEAGGGAIYALNSNIQVGLSNFEGNTTEGSGGAIRTFGGSTEIDGSNFTANTAVTVVDEYSDGGAISTFGGIVSINGAAFTANNASHAGGAVHIEEGALGSEVVDSQFQGNTADIGAGLRLLYSNVNVSDSTFIANTAGFLGGGATNFGGVSRFQSCVFEQNEGGDFAGGLSSAGVTSVMGCAFTGNSAEEGGAVVAFGDHQASLLNCDFDGNSAEEGSAVQVLGEADVTIMNSIVRNGVAPFAGGAIRASHYPDPSALDIANTVVFGNTGGGVIVEPGAESAAISNSIIRNNTLGPEYEGFDLAIHHSNIEGISPANGNIDENPLFINPVVGNFRLQPGSPCIDAGANSRIPGDLADMDLDLNTAERTPHDFDGAPRVMDDPAAANLG